MPPRLDRAIVVVVKHLIKPELALPIDELLLWVFSGGLQVLNLLSGEGEGGQEEKEERKVSIGHEK